ncbi:MAG: Gfo/Idh/MocA family oxidoreductase [Nocardioides sp.]
MKARPASPLGVALIGVGHVADRYVEQMSHYESVRLVGAASRSAANAQRFAQRHGVRAYASVDELLADPAVDLVVNLALHTAHAKLNARCLRAGKHVYSEKPLALDAATARELVALARRHRVRLGCAPSTFLGEAHQTAARLLRAGRIGNVRAIYAEVNHGRIENYHPAPEPFFAVGALWDVGVYPLTALTALFGPVRSVSATARLLLRDRVAKGGRKFRIRTPDFVVATLDLASGPVVRLTTNFYVSRDLSKGGGSIEYHGDEGRIFVGDFQSFDAPVELSVGSKPYAPVRPVRKPYPGIEFGRGLQDMADAIREDRPHRATGEHAAHVVDVIEALHRSIARDGAAMAVRSRFVSPAPLPWAT